jgi:hypothetical protein
LKFDLKFDFVIKSAFEQVEVANKPAKCAKNSISSHLVFDSDLKVTFEQVYLGS